MDSHATHVAESCPTCGSSDIEFDTVQALTFCLACGFVLADQHLDSSNLLFDASGQRAGVRVRGEDDGTRAGAYATGGRTRWTKSSQAHVQARVKVLCGMLGVPAGVQADAVDITEQLLPKIYGPGKNRDRLAAVAIYVAARFAKLPMTVVDVASAIRVAPRTFGRTFQSAVNALGIALPATPPEAFLSATVQKACSNKALQVPVLEDAIALQTWLAQQDMRCTPLQRCAAALTVALEAHSLKPKDVGKALSVSDKHLKANILDAKRRLLAAAQELPWSKSITTRNVALHLRTIVKLAQFKLDTPADSAVNECERSETFK